MILNTANVKTLFVALKATYSKAFDATPLGVDSGGDAGALHHAGE